MCLYYYQRSMLVDIASRYRHFYYHQLVDIDTSITTLVDIDTSITTSQQIQTLLLPLASRYRHISYHYIPHTTLVDIDTSITTTYVSTSTSASSSRAQYEVCSGNRCVLILRHIQRPHTTTYLILRYSVPILLYHQYIPRTTLYLATTYLTLLVA